LIYVSLVVAMDSDGSGDLDYEEFLVRERGEECHSHHRGGRHCHTHTHTRAADCRLRAAEAAWTDSA
jgi:hypothetical protein